MNETMLKRCFLISKKIKNRSAVSYSMQREHTALIKQTFLCFKMTLHLSILLQLTELL